MVVTKVFPLNILCWLPHPHLLNFLTAFQATPLERPCSAPLLSKPLLTAVSLWCSQDIMGLSKKTTEVTTWCDWQLWISPLCFLQLPTASVCNFIWHFSCVDCVLLQTVKCSGHIWWYCDILVIKDKRIVLLGKGESRTSVTFRLWVCFFLF